MQIPRFISRISLHLFGAIAVFLRFGCINADSCEVQQNPDGTWLYKVEEFRGTRCDYDWLNSSHHKLATNLAKKVDELVVTSSSQTLLTKKCVEKIIYIQDCEEKMHEVICYATCSGSVGHLQNRYEENGQVENGQVENGGTSPHHWLARVCILLPVLLVLLILGLI